MLASPAPPVQHPPPERDESVPRARVNAAKRVTATQFLADLARLGGMQVALAVAGLVRYKVLALKLGTSGLGEFQQLVTTVGTATVIVAFGLAFALNRNVATAADDARRQRLLATSNAIVWSLSALVLIPAFAVALLDPNIVSRVGLQATPATIGTLTILLLGVPFEALKNNFVTFLMASRDVRGMTNGRSLAVLGATVASIPLVWVFGPVGAALQAVAINVVLVAVLAYRCSRLGYSPLQMRVDRETAAVLIGFGAASLAAAFAQQFLDLAVRTQLITQYGVDQNGQYQSALLLAGQVQTIVLSGVGSYALATIGNEKDASHATASSHLMLQTVLPVAALAFAALGIFAKPLLILLYSAEFAAAVPFVPLVLATMMLEAVTWVIGAPLLALRGVKIWLILNLTHVSVRAAAALVLLPLVGPTAVVVGYFAGMCLHVGLHTYVFTRVLKLGIDTAHFRQLALGLSLIIGTAWFGARGTSPWLHYAVGLTLYAAYFVYVVHAQIGLARVRQMLGRLLPESSS